MSCSRKVKKSFTMIELMSVVAVLFVLVSVLIPALGRAVKVGRKIACANQLRQIALGFQHYFSDNDMLPAPYRFLEDFNPIAQYVNSKQVFRCTTSQTEIIENDELWYMNNDYYFSPGNLRDVELAGPKNNGHGNNPYRFDPSNPSTTTQAVIDAKRKECVVYDRRFPAHFDEVNLVTIGDMRYESQYGVSDLWILDDNYCIIRSLEPYPSTHGNNGSKK